MFCTEREVISEEGERSVKDSIFTLYVESASFLRFALLPDVYLIYVEDVFLTVDGRRLRVNMYWERPMTGYLTGCLEIASNIN